MERIRLHHPALSLWEGAEMKIRMFLSILLFHFTSVQSFEPQYVLLLSSVLRSDFQDKVCLHLSNLNETMSMSVILEYNGANTTIFDQSVSESPFFECKSFQVPRATAEHLAFVTFSAVGSTSQMSERRSVVIPTEEKVTFVQSDKPIYKPGQKVMFRIVTLDNNLKAVNESYPLVTVQDPDRNRIFQWLQVKPLTPIAEFSFQLISEPILGTYTITVRKNSEETVSHHFTVEEYVLPKYEVQVYSPEAISVEDQTFQVDVCAKYAYAQPVQGKAKIQVCRKYFSSPGCGRGQNEICQRFTLELNTTGCASQSLETEAFQLYRSGLYMLLEVKAIVMENGTGLQFTDSSTISISSMLGRIQFENMGRYYKKGIPYTGQFTLVKADNSPIENAVVQLELNDKVLANYTTDSNGSAQFSIDTSNIFDPQINLRASHKTSENCYDSNWLTPYYAQGYFSVLRFYSRFQSFLQIKPEPEELRCNQEKTITVYYSLDAEDYKDVANVQFYYLVMVRKVFVVTGQKEVSINGALNGSFSVSLTITPELAPKATMLIYTLHPRGEMVADSAKFQIEKCFKNQVSLKFSEDQGLPGSNVSLHLEAAANSYCALRVVDWRVLLLKPTEQLSAKTVFDLVLSQELFGNYQGLQLEDDKREPCISEKEIFYQGLYYEPVSNSGDGDTYEIVKEMGLKVFSNSRLRKPEVCIKKTFQPYPEVAFSRGQPYGTLKAASFSSSSSNPGFSDSDAQAAVKETVRKFFADTWIWELVTVGSSGSADLSFTMPDTITRWDASGFCVADQAGFGISSNSKLIGFQHFFSDLNLPYSVVQGEQFELTGNIFNYLDHCVEISALLEESANYEIQRNSPQGSGNVIVGANEKKTYIWTMTPKTLGEVNLTMTAETVQSQACGTSEQQSPRWKDTLIRVLLVEPEGIEKEMTQSILICTEDTDISEQVSLRLPGTFVNGSARADFTVLGDCLGQAMQNLENLLQMPYGCGEQNIALLASDVAVLKYLIATDQLTEELRSKAISFLASGYQKQLSYKLFDGSYSTFGRRDMKGDTRLTAIVFKTFGKMKDYTYIDETVQSQTMIWLSRQQKENGCFMNQGKPFNNALEGGDTDEVSLTALVVGALLQTGLNSTHSLVRRGLICLNEAYNRIISSNIIYSQVLMAYTFALARQEEKVESLLQRLDQSAKKDGSTVHWEREKKPRPDDLPSFSPRAPSAEVEITCYGLLAVISKAVPDLTLATKIVLWIVKQQNPYGGFSSTQDTAICLDALSLYETLTFSKGQNTVTISSEKSSEVFQVNGDNRLLLQRSNLVQVPGNYTVDVAGKGCAFIQTTLRYNVLLSQMGAGFSLYVETANSSCTDGFQDKFDLFITTSYTGIRNNSNMVIVDVKMLSGYSVVSTSMEKLQENTKVMKTEIKNNHLLIYLENLRSEISFMFSVEQTLPISNIKPASVKIYDYYETDEYGLAEYNTPCGQTSA
ncbi:ovostatin homolog 2-like [Tachyglossus aculeatus]|uniref:ovostatin homolog 2-like n=1 Tax=Tachyglossus aculeatus TaxID=9261 RepID=UPI0018F73872|nr:ovostatin homolog 2-like [Tachyglossus aculeatus]